MSLAIAVAEARNCWESKRGAKKPRLATNVLRAGNRLPARPQKLHDSPERLGIRDKKCGEHKVTQVQSAKRNNQSKCIRRKPANSRNIARVQTLDSVAMREDDDAFSKGMYSGGENENSENELEERQDVGVEEGRIVCDSEVGNGSDGEHSVPHGNGDDDELEVEENNGMVEDVGAEKRIERSEDQGTRHGLLSEDAAVLQSLFSGMRKDVKCFLNESEEKAVKHQDETKKRFDDLETSIRELQSTVAMSLARGSFKTERQAILDMRVSILNNIVRDDVTQNLLEQVLIGTMSKHFQRSTYLQFPSAAAKMMRMAFFSRLPSQKMDRYLSEDGVLHCHFRRGLVLSTLRALQVDSVGLFASRPLSAPVEVNPTPPSQSESTGGYCSDRQSQHVEKEGIHKPLFLNPGYITAEHCAQVAEAKDGRVPEKKKAKKEYGYISRQEVALHAVHRLYTIITNMLHDRRMDGKRTFFEELGYLFISWSEHKSSVSQKGMKIWWDQTEKKNVRFTDLEDMITVDYAERKRQVCEDDDELACNKRNMSKIDRTIAEHPYLVLYAEHEVAVKQDDDMGNRKRSAVQPSVMILKRSFNLLHVACKMISEYCGMGSCSRIATFLSCHRYSFRCAFVVAHFIRELCELFVDEFRHNGTTWILPTRTSSTTVNRLSGTGNTEEGQEDSSDDECGSRSTKSSGITGKKVHGISLRDLLPAHSKRCDILNANILTVTRAEFKMRAALHVCRPIEEEDLVDGDLGKEAIPLDEDSNVFTFGTAM